MAVQMQNAFIAQGYFLMTMKMKTGIDESCPRNGHTKIMWIPKLSRLFNCDEG
jgi:hypothetical protein